MPLSEREAARTVGALILNRQAAAKDPPKQSANKIPLDLQVDLTTPETAESMRATARVAEMGLGAVSIFRGAWKLAGNVRPLTARRLLAGPTATSAALHA